MRYVPYHTPNNGTVYQSIPTIGNIGGYLPYQNMGYYNQYFNPYYIRQQEEAQRRLQIQETQNQIDIWSKIIQSSNKVLGYENIDDQNIKDQIQKRALMHQQYSADQEFVDKIRSLTQQAYQQKMQQQMIQESIERQQEEASQEIHEPQTFMEWLHGDAQNTYMESQYAKMRSQQRNTSNLYNSNSYNQLLNAHESVFSSLNRDVNIDDMEIQVNLPERLRRERDIRRQRFAESLRRGI